MVQTFLKLFGDNFLFPAQNVSSLAVQLYYVGHVIFQFFQCYYYKKLFSEKILFYACTGLLTSLIKVLKVLEHNFFILKFHCFMFLFSFITSKYSFFRKII